MILPCSLRPGRVSDADTLTEIAMRSKAHWGYDRSFMAACRAELTMTPARILDEVVVVAESDSGEPVGFGSYRRNGGNTVEITNCFVVPEAMGAGVGRRIVSALDASAEAESMAVMLVDSDPQAQVFYERLGFSLIGESPSGSIAGRLLPRLRRDLADGRISRTSHRGRSSAASVASLSCAWSTVRRNQRSDCALQCSGHP